MDRLGTFCCLKNRENREVGTYSDSSCPVIQKTYNWKLVAKLDGQNSVVDISSFASSTISVLFKG